MERSSTTERWANLLAHTNDIQDRDHGRFMRISTDRINEFVKSIDDMMAGFETSYDLKQEGKTTENRTLGVGVFYFEEDKKDSNFFQ